MKNRILLSILIYATAGGSYLMAQDQCLNAVSNANAAYNSGQLSQCIELLQNCLLSLDSKEEKVEAYRLLALSYYSLNETDKMHENMVHLLQHKPNYKDQSLGRDPIGFTKELATYSIKPHWSVGIRLGYVSNQVNVVENHQAFAAAESDYLSSPSYAIGMHVQKRLPNSLIVSGTISARGAAIRHELNLDEEYTQTYDERMDLLGVALGLAYPYSLSSNWSVNLSLEVGYNHMYGNRVNLELYEGINLVDQQSFDQLDNRIKGQPTLGGGLDFEYDLANGSIALGVSYLFYLGTTIDKEKLYSDIEFNLATLYNNDLVQLRQMNLTVRYTYPINFRIARN